MPQVAVHGYSRELRLSPCGRKRLCQVHIGEDQSEPAVRLKLCLSLLRKGRLWKQRSVSADRWTTEVSMTPDLGFVRLHYFKLRLASQVLWFWNAQISLLWFWNNFLAVLRLTISSATSWPNDIKLITVLSSISHKPTFLQTILSMKKIILFKIDVICAWT